MHTLKSVDKKDNQDEGTNYKRQDNQHEKELRTSVCTTKRRKQRSHRKGSSNFKMSELYPMPILYPDFPQELTFIHLNHYTLITNVRESLSGPVVRRKERTSENTGARPTYHGHQLQCLGGV